MIKEKLISELEAGGYLKTPRLIEAFQKIDRKHFVPEELEKEAYLNEPLPIGHNQTISQPLTVAFMLELLDPRPGEKILDIGAGSGWQTALLSYVVGQSGKVIGLERILPLKAIAETNVGKYSFITKKIAEIFLGDGSKGYLDKAPYDKIIAAASAKEIPEVWKDQLKIGGRLVAPVGHSIFSIDKVSETEFKEEEHYGFSFVPLIAD